MIEEVINEKFYKDIFLKMTNGFIIQKVTYDESGKPAGLFVVDANPAIGRLGGIDVELLKGKNLFELFPDFDPVWMEKGFEAATTGRELTFEGFHKFLNKWLKVIAYSPAEGYLVTITEDITERKTAEKRLRESEALFSSAFYGSPLLMSISEIETGRFIDVNDYFCRILGFTRDEIIGETSIALGIIKPENRAEMISGFASAGRVSGFETELFRKNGLPVLCRIYGDKIIISGEDKLLVIVEDITEKKKAETEIQNLLEQKEILLREVHHRIKNNMNTIAGLLKLQSLSINDPAAIDALNEARVRVQNMMLIYDRLYRSADYKNLNARDYFDNLLNEIVKLFPNNGRVNFIKKIDDFKIDSKILFTIGIMINELITNAFKYAFDGIGNPEIVFSLTSDNGRVSFTVKDNGSGLPDDVKTGRRNGFGLNLVSSLTEQLEGVMKFGENKGTEITVEFAL